MATKPYLSIVIPAYNEEDNIKKGTFGDIIAYLSQQKYTYEIIIIDDGSTDNTLKLLRNVKNKYQNLRLIENKHQGKAVSVTTGMLKAAGTYILFCDFDQATPLEEIEKILPFFKTHDIVIGSRSNQREGAPLSRKVMARGFMWLRSILLGIGVEDTQCGFKGFKQSAAQAIFKKLRLYKNNHTISGSRVTAGFDVEVLFLAHKMGYSIKEVPVTWHYVETKRVNPLRDSWDAVVDLLRIKILDIKGIYK